MYDITLTFLILLPDLIPPRSLRLSYRYRRPACVSSSWPRTRSHPPHQTFQYFWLCLVVQPGPLFNQGARLHHSHGQRCRRWRLFNRSRPHTASLLRPNYPIELPNSPRPRVSNPWLLPRWTSSPICCLACKYDLARCFGQLCPLQYPPQKLRQARPRPHYPRTLLLPRHGWQLLLVLDPRLPFHGVEHVQLGLLDCSEQPCCERVVRHELWLGNERSYLRLVNDCLHWQSVGYTCTSRVFLLPRSSLTLRFSSGGPN